MSLQSELDEQLIVAVKNEDDEKVRELLERDAPHVSISMSKKNQGVWSHKLCVMANPRTMDENGKSVLDIAKEKKNDKIVRLLEKAMTRWDAIYSPPAACGGG